MTNIDRSGTPTFRALLGHEKELVRSVRADLIGLATSVEPALALDRPEDSVDSCSSPVARSCTIATCTSMSFDLLTEADRHAANRSDRSRDVESISCGQPGVRGDVARPADLSGAKSNCCR